MNAEELQLSGALCYAYLTNLQEISEVIKESG